MVASGCVGCIASGCWFSSARLVMSTLAVAAHDGDARPIRLHPAFRVEFSAVTTRIPGGRESRCGHERKCYRRYAKDDTK